MIIQIVRKFVIDMKDHKKEKLKALKKADEKLKKENRKKKKNKKSKKVLGAVLGTGAAVILAGYVGMGFYFQDKFYVSLECRLGLNGM